LCCGAVSREIFVMMWMAARKSRVQMEAKKHNEDRGGEQSKFVEVLPPFLVLHFTC